MPFGKLGKLDVLALESTATCDNPCLILSTDNVLQFLSDVVLRGYVGGDAFATVPEGMRPKSQIRKVVLVGSLQMVLTIEPSGELRLNSGTTQGTVSLNGLCVSVSDFYYNAENGNNTPQGTAPSWS